MKNKYEGFFNGKQKTFEAVSLIDAKNKAIDYFHPRRGDRHMVHVHLVELAGQQIYQTTQI